MELAHICLLAVSSAPGPLGESQDSGTSPRFRLSGREGVFKALPNIPNENY